MPLRRTNLSNILLYAIIIVALYLAQRISVMEITSPEVVYACYRELLYPEYIVCLLALFGLTAWYIYVEKKKGNLQFHIPLIILLSALFVISVVSILTFPSVIEVDVPVFNRILTSSGYSYTELDYYKHAYIYLSGEQRILYIIVSFASLYLVYLFLYVFPRKIRYTRSLNFIMYLILGLAAVAIIYSLCAEFDEYVKFFQLLPNPDTVIISSNIKSFVGNKNTLGILATFALFACLYIHHTNDKWWFLLIALIFPLFCIIISSKTNVLICLLTYIIYIIVWVIVRFKKHIAASVVIIGIISHLIVFAIALEVVHNFNPTFMSDFFIAREKLFNYFVTNALTRANQFSGRDRQYDRALILINGGFWGFGMGYGLFNYLFLGMENLSSVPNLYVWDENSIVTVQSSYLTSCDSPHSSYYQIIGTGGIFTLIIYFLMIAYLIMAIISIFKKHKLTALLCSIFLLGALLHSLTESPTLFFASPVLIDSFCFTLFAAVPVLSLYHHDRHPSENRKFLADFEQNREILFKYNKFGVVSKSAYFFMTPLVVIGAVIAPITWNPFGGQNLNVLVTMIIMIMLYFLIPLLCYILFDEDVKFSEFLSKIFLPHFCELLALSVFVCLCMLIFGEFTLTMAGVVGIFIILAHIAIFVISPFYFSKAGVITYWFDGISLLTHKHQKKFIELSNEKDSMTLQEKFFNVFTPKRFRRNETRDN